MNKRIVCKRQRCARRADVGGLCKTHAMQEADKLFSASVRARGSCEARKRQWLGPGIECNGVTQCAHLISRRYRSTRHDPMNAVPLCGAHHQWLDLHPLEKDKQCESWLGSDAWRKLCYDALNKPAPDLADIIEHFAAVA